MPLILDVQVLLAVLIGSLVPTMLWVRAEVGRRRAEQRLVEILGLQGSATRGAGIVEAVRGQSRRFELLESELADFEQRLDRLGESHDFLSRLLADRIEQIADPRLRTPH